jgi:ABC-2 type transport system permease protein
MTRLTILRLELRRSRSLALWLAIALAGYGAVIAAMYPIMVENDELFTQYMQTFPQELLAAFGMTGSLSDPGIFYTTYIASWLWPIIAAVAALLTGTRVAVDLDRGFLDLPLSTPTSRVRYLGAGIAGQALLLAVLAASAVGSVWLGARIVGSSFDAGRFAVAGVLSWLFGCAIAGTATILAVLTLSRGRASGIVGGLLIAMYLVYVVVGVNDDWAPIAPLSAWDHFRTTSLIDDGVIPWADLALFAGIAAGAWAAALAVFRRRDLAA